MTASELLTQFEAAPRLERLSLGESLKSYSGIGREFFVRVATLLGENPTQALALSTGWDIVANNSDDPSWAWRARGVKERIEGKWAASAKSFARAGALCANPVDQWSFQVGAIDSLARAGKVSEAVALGERIIRALNRLGAQDLAGRAALNTGNALLWADEHHRARRYFDKASKLLAGSSFALEYASATLGLSTVALFINTPSRAKSLAEMAIAEFVALGAEAYADHARANLAHCEMLQGRPDSALRLYLELRSECESNSTEYARLCQFMGDAYLELQVPSLAIEAYETALEIPAMAGEKVNQANCWLGIGEAKLKHKRFEEAMTALKKARAIFKKRENLAWVADTDYLLALSTLGHGNKVVGLRKLRLAVNNLQERNMLAQLAKALLDLAEFSPDPAESAAALVNADKLIRAGNYIGLEWRVHALLATKSTGEATLARYRAMIRSIILHRSTLTSLTARNSLLENRQESIREYLAILIRTRTVQAREEAMRTVIALRSATLIDEMLLAADTLLSAQQRGVLAELRASFADTEEDRLPGQPFRRSAASTSRASEKVIMFVESLGLIPLKAATQEANESNSNLLVFFEEQGAWLTANRQIDLPLGVSDLARKLRFVQLEILSEISSGFSDHTRLNRDIAGLSRELRLSELQNSRGLCYIAPETAGFTLPWSAMMDAEPVLQLRPGSTADPHQVLGPDAKVAVWYFSRPDLPQIQTEVEYLLKLYPNARVFETAEEVLRSASEGPYDLVHVAAHGQHNSENPMFSHIQLRGGHLLACDLAYSGLKTRIAVLSSCDSAVVTEFAGWESQGLASAFLACQAKVVVGSLWPLHDHAAAIGSKVFYNELKAGSTVPTALKACRQKIQAKFAHPAYWASATMIQGYFL